jgi:hypothetical protein
VTSARYIELRTAITTAIVIAILLGAAIYQALELEWRIAQGSGRRAPTTTNESEAPCTASQFRTEIGQCDGRRLK